MKKFVFVVTLLAIMVPFAVGQQLAAKQEATLSDLVQMARSNVRSDKVTILTKAMLFTEAEGAKFWPIYREYEFEMGKHFDKDWALIKLYADNFENITEEMANTLAKGVFDLETERTSLKRKYFKKIETVLSAKRAARFIQVENQLLLIIDLRIASQIPLIQ